MDGRHLQVLPAVCLLVAGSLFGAGFLWDRSSASPAEYDHFVDRGTAVEGVPQDARYNFSGLSAGSEALFVETVERGGEYRSEGQSMSEFQYAQDNAGAGDGIYWIRYEGTWWRLYVSHAGGIFEGAFHTLVLANALVMVVVGLFGLWRPHSTVPPAVLTGTVAWGVPIAAYGPLADSVDLVVVFAAVLIGMPVVPLTIVALDRWHRWPVTTEYPIS